MKESEIRVERCVNTRKNGGQEKRGADERFRDERFRRKTGVHVDVACL